MMAAPPGRGFAIGWRLRHRVVAALPMDDAGSRFEVGGKCR